MTREEAIDIMKAIIYMLEPMYDTDRVEDAVSMAIKALEQELILDKIKEEVELKRKMYLDMNDIDWLNGCDYVLSVIDKYKRSNG